MRKFIVNVNGTSYEVEVEEITGAAPVQVAAPAPAPVQAAPVQQEVKPAAPVSGSGEKVTSPMPGSILDVKVKEGDVVKTGQTLVVLEAMKMENEIPAPRDGRIVSVNTVKGATVNSGDVLCVIG